MDLNSNVIRGNAAIPLPAENAIRAGVYRALNDICAAAYKAGRMGKAQPAKAFRECWGCHFIGATFKAAAVISANAGTHGNALPGTYAGACHGFIQEKAGDIRGSGQMICRGHAESRSSCDLTVMHESFQTAASGSSAMAQSTGRHCSGSGSGFMQAESRDITYYDRTVCRCHAEVRSICDLTSMSEWLRTGYGGRSICQSTSCLSRSTLTWNCSIRMERQVKSIRRALTGPQPPCC